MDVSCNLCGQLADFVLVFQLEEHRVELPLCETHLEILKADMPDPSEKTRVRVSIKPLTSDSLVPSRGAFRATYPPSSK